MTKEDLILNEIAELKKLYQLANKDAFTIEEAAEFLALSVHYIYNLVSQKKITYYKSATGGRVMFKRADLVNWQLATRHISADEAAAAMA